MLGNGGDEDLRKGIAHVIVIIPARERELLQIGNQWWEVMPCGGSVVTPLMVSWN